MYTGPSIIRNGLVLALDAANTKSYVSESTVWSDLSGNSNSGSLINGPTFNSANGGSIVFDGTNDYVVFPQSSVISFPNANFSVGCWFKSIQNKAYCGFLGQISPTVTTGWAFELHLGKIQMWLSLNIYTSPLTYNDNKWHQAYVTCGNPVTGNLILYIDGVQIYLTTMPTYSVDTTTYPLWVGGWTGGNTFLFNGNLSQVSIYKRVLSSQEVLQNYNVTKTRFGL